MSISRILGLGLLVFSLTLVGCGDSEKTTPPKDGGKKKVADKEKDDHDDHDHGEGPHGGLIVEFGKYHGEFVVDHDKKQATVYILDGKVKNAVPLATEKVQLSIKSPQFQTELKASPQEGDPKGKSSRFIGTHENLGKKQEFEGTISCEVDGKQILGDFKEDEHHHEKDAKKK